ncbi:glycine cleavage system protein H [Chromatiales bacterium (ex Bugula neritina AB1)]|nr:glycine cleavage system protein H [Chromatiales bacterium (ex Bugula neritina AB1)]
MNAPNDLKYTQSHEWVRLNDDGSVTVGITDHAQEQLGDLVFVETPEVDSEVESEDAVAVVESVKAASDIYAPISGTISDSNSALADEPELVNSDPYGGGWLYSMAPSDGTEIEQLMDHEAYESYVTSQG